MLVQSREPDPIPCYHYGWNQDHGPAVELATGVKPDGAMVGRMEHHGSHDIAAAIVAASRAP
jgi:hypothetical protein